MPLNKEAVAVPVGRSATAPGPAPAQPSAQRPKSNQASTAPLTPPIDIYEGADGLVLEADLPGVPDHLLSIQLEDNVLNLRGQAVSPLPEGAEVLHEEYRSGDFRRSFILSDEVDRSRISASFKDGVLRIILPKAERSRTRRIEIKTS